MNVSLLFLRPLVLTLLFEVSASIVIGLRKPKQLLLVVLVNVLSNPLLHLSAGLLYRYLPLPAVRVMVYVILEPLVILLEGWIYAKSGIIPRPYRNSFILNVISLGGGLIWNCLR